MMPASPSIRRATPADAAAITALVNQAYAPYVPRIGQKPAPMLDDYGQVIEQCQVYVAPVQGALCGVLVLARQGDILQVQNVAVSTNARGQGLGRLLMSFAEQRAAELGCSAMALYTNELMSENILIYSKLGYQETHRAVEQGYARVFMRKLLVG